MADYTPSEVATEALAQWLYEQPCLAEGAPRWAELVAEKGQGECAAVWRKDAEDILTAAVPLELQRERERLASEIRQRLDVATEELQGNAQTSEEHALILVAAALLAAALPTEEGEG